jgi:hypothetical protein
LQERVSQFDVSKPDNVRLHLSSGAVIEVDTVLVAAELVHHGLLVMMANGGADLIHRTCFNYPTLGDLYTLATRRALFPQIEASLSKKASTGSTE